MRSEDNALMMRGPSGLFTITMDRPVPFKTRAQTFFASSSFSYHFSAFQFNLADTAQYWLAWDHLLKNVRLSDHPITRLLTRTDITLFSVMFVGMCCTLVANQRAYYLLLKERAEDKVSVVPSVSRLVACAVTGSVLNKSIPVAGSFSALIYSDTENTVLPTLGFFAAFFANTLAQSGVQGVSDGWYAGFNKIMATILAVLGTSVYSGSLFALAWMGMDVILITGGLLEVAPELMSPINLAKAIFLLPSVIRVPCVYFERIRNRLGKKGDYDTAHHLPMVSPSEPARCESVQVIMGYGSTLQRTLYMLLSLAAVLYALNDNPYCAIALAICPALFAGSGAFKCNLSILGHSSRNQYALFNGIGEVRRGTGEYLSLQRN